MIPKRSTLSRPRRRRRGGRPYWPAIQQLENRLMLTGPPVANNDAYTGFHDRALIATTPSSGVLANDTDPNGYALTANLVTGVAHGTLTLNPDGTFVYMPTAGFSGSDSFAYRDWDGTYDSNIATVTIAVQTIAVQTVADAALTAQSVPVGVTEGQSFSGTVASFTDADPSGALGDYQATIDWGDGNFGLGTVVVGLAGGFDVTATHTYAGRGPYTTTVTIHDQGGAAATVSGTVAVAVPPPLVTIAATQPNANASGVAGIFTVTRTGDTTQALTVNYQVAGTALAGSDYQALTGSVTFPAGAASAQVVVNPLGDPNPLVPDPLTVQVQLLPSASTPPAYLAGVQAITAADTATGTIGTEGGIVISSTFVGSPPSLAPPAPELAGQGLIGTQIVQIAQDGNSLTFTNELGGTSPGYIQDAGHVVATGWGNLVGTVTTTFEGLQINWANGSTWYLPRLAGTWFIKGNESTQIVQPGNGDSLTFINEYGGSSAGYIQDNGHVVATDWGNLVGTLVPTALGIQIDWANGSAWVQPRLAGQGVIGTQDVQVAQDGSSLTFTNQYGETSPGYIQDPDHVVATGWGNLVGTLSSTFDGLRINWADGTAWDLLRLAGTWFISGNQTTQIVQPGNGDSLTFINEHGDSSAGYIQDSSHVVATNWGNLVGTLVPTSDGVRIDWANGSSWNEFELGGPPPTTPTLELTGVPAVGAAGTAFSVTVTALQPNGAVDPNYRGTVHFTSTDPAALLPDDYTFTAADAGTHTFLSTFETPSANPATTVTIAQDNPSLYFIQGNVYNDASANNQFDPTDPPIAGATMQLYKADGTTLLGTTTTDAAGSYLFDSANVAGGQLLPGTYRIGETPPAGYQSEGVQASSALDTSSVVASNAIQVTLPVLTGLTLTYDSVGAADIVTVEADGMQLHGYAGFLNLSLAESGSGLGSVTTDCVSLLTDVFLGDTFNVTPQPLSTGLAMNGGQIGWLIDHFGGAGSTLDDDQAAGLQLAIWALEYNSTPSLSTGNFIATTPGVTAAALADANAYLAESAGKSAMAVYFDAVYTVGGNSPDGSQSMASTDSFNFSNVAGSQPSSSLSGVVYVDANNNGKPDKGEPTLGGVRVILSGTNDQGSQVTATAVTGADGSYDFQQLYPGTYSITEIDPTGYVDAKDTIGSAGGTVGHDTFTAITLGLGVDATGYDFGWERAPKFISTPVLQIAVGVPYAYQATATDADGDPLTYTLLEGPAGMTASAGGEITWAPGSAAVGTHPVDLQVSDGRGGLAQQPFTVTVIPSSVNTPPYFTSKPVLSAIVGKPYTYQATAADPDGDVLSFSVFSGPSGLSIPVAATGLVTWTPLPSQLGSDSVTLKVSDGHGNSATQPYTIVVSTPANDAVAITSSPITIATADNPYIYTVMAISSLKLPLTYSLTGTPPSGMTINPVTGQILWPSAVDGSYPIAVHAVDTGGAFDNQTYTLTVSDLNTLEGQKYTVVPSVTPTTPPDAGAPPNYAPPISMVPISGLENGPADVVYDGATNSLIVTVNNFLHGGNSLEQILSDGTTNSAFAGGTAFIGDAELQLAEAQPGTTTAFQVGDIYVGNGQYANNGAGAIIAKISNDGHTIETPWVTLPFENPIGALAIDTTGVWGGDMVAASTRGDIYTITPQGTHTLIASVPSNVEGLTTVPNDPARYGPLAGTILAGSGDFSGSDLYVITKAGTYTTYPLNIGDTESIFIVPPNANFYGTDLGTNSLLGASATDFTSLVGEIVVVQEGFSGGVPQGTTGLFRLHWDGTQIDSPISGTNPLTYAPISIPLTSGSSQPMQWEGTTFTSFVVPPLKNSPPTVGLPNWTINLESYSTGQVIASTTTDAQGNYSFTDVPAGTYTVAEVPQTGWTQFAPVAQVYTVTVTSDRVVSELDFGNQETIPAPDPGPVFSPTNYNGPTKAQVGQRYTYAPVAADADHDQITYSLGLAPPNMVIDPTTGVIVWTPLPNQVGFQSVDVVANDGKGNVATQFFSLPVEPAELPPVITSTPPTPAYAAKTYTYQVHAVSPLGDPVSFSFGSTHPTDMNMTAAGLLTWTNPVLNSNPAVIIDVTDDDNNVSGTPQSFTLPVIPAPGSDSITLQAPPRGSILIGQTFAYLPVATDTYNAPLTYTLTSYPTDMTLDPSTNWITWTPTAQQLGVQTMVLQISDGYVTNTWTFPITVTDQDADQPPKISPPAPPQYAVVGNLYRFNLMATDAAGNPLDPQFWSLDSGPTGMVLDPGTDALIWTPTPDQANTVPTITVQVHDGQGGTAGLTFQVDVLASDTPPEFSDFTPPTLAGVGVPYAYQVMAADADGSPVAYSVTANPAPPQNDPITISSSGLLQWSNPTPLGPESITVTASDFAGLAATETFALTVQSTPPGSPPVFQPPAPPQYAAVGFAYSYTPSLTYTAGDNVTYAISSASGMTNLSVNPTTGAVEWTPTSTNPNEVGAQTITITATDNTVGLSAYLTFPVTVTTDTPPTLSGLPPRTIIAGQTYVYQFQATGATGFELLGTVPTGISIDSSGRLTWPTTTADIAGSPYPIEVEAVNADGLTSAPNSFTITVNGETQAPTVQIEMSSNPANLNSTVFFDVIASDEVGATALSLTVDSTPIVLDSNGRGHYDASTLGQLSVVATAFDAAGLQGNATATLSVIDPTDISAPTVSIAAPSDQSSTPPPPPITSPTEVVGTVSDSHILSWTLDEAQLNSSTFTTIATGTSTVNDADLGLFDPTNLANGAYTLRLTAWNAGGHSSVAEITVNVSGYLKLGNLDLSFTDLTIPVAGIPITITRTYNSLNANTAGDFGYGWTLSEMDYQLNVSTLGNGLGSLGDYTPLEQGNRVVVTKPDGTEEGFTFDPQQVTDPDGLVVEYYVPHFDPDAGVTDTLSVPSVDLSLIPGTGEFYGGDDDADYNPAQPEFGGSYTLTNESGIATTFDATTGQVTSESDRHNNTLTFQDNGIFSNTGLEVQIVRDPQHGNRITEIIDPNQNTIIYTYNPTTGDLASVTDRDNNITQFAYSTAQPHFLTQITDGMGNVVMSGQYNPSGRLTSIANATGQSDTLSYNLSNLSESATAPGNTNPTTNTYNTEGLLTKSVDADGNETDYSYTNNFLTSKTQIIDGVLETTTYTNNQFGQPLTETDPSGATTYFGYDQYGDPFYQTDAQGNTTYFNYYLNPDDPNDPMNGDLLSTTDPAGSIVSATYDNSGDFLTTTTSAGTTVNTYDPYGNLKTTTSPQGVTTTNTYDNDGNLKTSAWVWTNPGDPADTETLETANTYDGDGNLTETQTYDNNVLQTTTSSAYDADNRVISSTDALGGVTTTIYDANGNVIQTTTPDGMITDSVYDAQGRVIYTDDPHLPGEPANGTHTIYDENGNVTGTERLANVVITVPPPIANSDVSSSTLAAVGAILSTTSTTYDAAGRVMRTVDASGMITNNTYDNVGNLKETDEIVNGVTRRTTSNYNALGEVTSTTDARGNETQYQYNAAGQVTLTTFEDGSTITDKYDSQGNKIAEIDQNGLETDYQYDQYGELKEVVEPYVLNPAGQMVQPTYQYQHDNYGDQISTTDALNRTTTYGFDAFGHMVSETLPMSQTGSWNYNTLGQLLKFTDFDGNVTEYSYYTSTTATPGVSTGELEQKTIYAPNSQTAYETVSYQYHTNNDSAGDYHDIVTDTIATGISAGTTTTDSEYDVNGNLIQIKTIPPSGSNIQATTISYAYDAATGEETEVYTSNTDTHYAYDQAGELKTVTVTKLDGNTLALPLVTSYSYNLDGELVSTQNTNSTTETRTYNNLNQLTSIVDTGPSGVYASFAYTYDLAGHVLTETDLSGRTYIYKYDKLYRLTQQSISDPASGSRTLTWSYDLVGNRVASTDTGAPTDQQKLVYSYDNNDELTGVVGYELSSGQWVQSDYSQTYHYDSDGNTTTVMTTTSSGSTTAIFTWDPSGRMIGYSSGSKNASYTYDDSGNRTSETINGQTTTFLNDPNQAYDQVLEEYAPGGVQAATYIRGIDLLFEDQSGTLSYYATDNLGSTRALTNSSGVVSDTDAYDAYGDLIASVGSTPDPYLYAGQWYDLATSQYLMRARVMLPSLGRFLSRDGYAGDIRDPLSLQKYLYAQGDPVDNVDPSGHGINISPSIINAVIAKIQKYGKTLGARASIDLVVRALIGIEVTYVLGNAYRSEVVNSRLVQVNLQIGRNGDQDLPQLAEDVVGWIFPLFKLRPDILDRTTNPGPIYEIKPQGEQALGGAQIAKYLPVLHYRYPNQAFVPGTWSPQNNPYSLIKIPGIGGFSAFSFTAENVGGGVITYQTYPPEQLIEALLFLPEIIQAASSAGVAARAAANVASTTLAFLGGTFGVVL